MTEVFKGEGPLETSISVEGLKEIQEEMIRIAEEIDGNPVIEAMAKATLIVTRSARMKAPVDRGALRASIVPDIVTRTNEVQGVVGSNLRYAPYQEFGTRAFTPPIGPIWAWALRKTKNNFKRASRLFVKAMMSIRGRGIKPKKYLQRALEQNADRIFKIIGDAVGNIIRRD